MSATHIRFPVRLRCDAQTIDLGYGASVRTITPEDQLQLMGIKGVVLDADGRIKSYVVETADPLGNLMGPDLDQYDQLYSSNYVAIVASYEDAKALNLAFKLLARSCTALFIGTAGDIRAAGHTQHFLSPPCYYGSQPLMIDTDQSATLRTLFTACRSVNGDKKLSVMVDIFMYAMSVAPRSESRCIELSIVLEMLLLPKASTELGYRFALRMTKLASVHMGESSVEWFAKGQQIYRTRSRLVHSGHDDKLNLTTELVEDISRRLLAAYLRNPELFEDAALDALCIAA